MKKIILGLALLILNGCAPIILQAVDYDDFRNQALAKGLKFTAESYSETTQMSRGGMGAGNTQSRANQVALEMCSKVISDCTITRENNNIVKTMSWQTDQQLINETKNIDEANNLKITGGKTAEIKKEIKKKEFQTDSKFSKKCEGSIFSKRYKKGTKEYDECIKTEEKIAALDEQKIGLLNEEKNKQLALVEEKKKKEIEEKNKKKEDSAKAEEERIQKKNTITFSDGSKYVGKLKNGISHGYGTFTDIDGEICNGEWQGHRTGKVITCIWPNTESEGQKYIGMLKNGKREGTGKYFWPNGGEYIGEWKDGHKNGQGTYTFADGAKYIGEYQDNKLNGTGTLKWADGTVYVGEFYDGERHGHGVFFL